jgi:hypothetical protein
MKNIKTEIPFNHTIKCALVETHHRKYKLKVNYDQTGLESFLEAVNSIDVGNRIYGMVWFTNHAWMEWVEDHWEYNNSPQIPQDLL